jgi:hypothetical protein
LLGATDLLPVILSPVSLTEFPAYWCEHPELFASISEGQTEQERVERVLRWFIGTLKAQYTVSRRGRGCGVGGVDLVSLVATEMLRPCRRVTRRWARRRR